MRIEQQAQRNVPMGDTAFGVGLQRILEDLLRCAIPKRVLIKHCLIEELLRFRLA